MIAGNAMVFLVGLVTGFATGFVFAGGLGLVSVLWEGISS